VAGRSWVTEVAGDDIRELFLDMSMTKIFDATFGDDHKVSGALEDLGVMSKDLANPALDPVAPDSVAHLLGDRDAEARNARR